VPDDDLARLDLVSAQNKFDEGVINPLAEVVEREQLGRRNPAPMFKEP